VTRLHTATDNFTVIRIFKISIQSLLLLKYDYSNN
jgi:hypothetical protein